MTTGDLRNNLRKLHSELKLVSYCGELDIEGLSTGKPSAFLPILHFVLADFSLDLAQYFYSKDYELLGKSDMKFLQVVYKILRDEFSVKVPITKDQFFTLGFAERKLQFVTSVLQLCRNKSEALKPRRRKTVPASSTGITSRNKPYVLQHKACGNRDAVVSKQVTVDTHSRNFSQVAGPNSEKSAPTTSLTRKKIPQHVSVNAVHRKVPVAYDEYMKNNLKNGPLVEDVSVLNTSTKQYIPNRRCGPNIDTDKAIPMEADFTRLSKENIPPDRCSKPEQEIPQSNCDKNSSLHEQIDGHLNLDLSPIPLTPQNTISEEHVGISSHRAINTKDRYPKDIFVEQTEEVEESCQCVDDVYLVECLEKLTMKQESAAILEYFRKQQSRIQALEKDAAERSAHFQELVKKNSQLSSRVMVLETAVALLEEKIN